MLSVQTEMLRGIKELVEGGLVVILARVQANFLNWSLQHPSVSHKQGTADSEHINRDTTQVLANALNPQ